MYVDDKNCDGGCQDDDADNDDDDDDDEKQQEEVAVVVVMMVVRHCRCHRPGRFCSCFCPSQLQPLLLLLLR